MNLQKTEKGYPFYQGTNESPGKERRAKQGGETGMDKSKEKGKT